MQESKRDDKELIEDDQNNTQEDTDPELEHDTELGENQKESHSTSNTSSSTSPKSSPKKLTAEKRESRKNGRKRSWNSEKIDQVAEAAAREALHLPPAPLFISTEQPSTEGRITSPKLLSPKKVCIKCEATNTTQWRKQDDGNYLCTSW